jgi:ferredoxin
MEVIGGGAMERFVDRAGFEALLVRLSREGYRLIGPTVRDGAIVLEEIDGTADLPWGVGEEQEAGRYRLTERDDDRAFAFAHGPDSAKRFLFPPRERFASIRATADDLTVETPEPEERPLAFVGLRPCDVAAIAVQDRVFVPWDPAYTARRKDAFILTVDCAEPASTCFCTSMGTGPVATAGFDLALTELDDGFLARTGTPGGETLLRAISSRPATARHRAAATIQAARAREAIERSVDTEDLPAVLAGARRHPAWEAVAEICLACGNCTAVCPTCFCHDVTDQPSLVPGEAERTREWASCFSEEFSHIVGGSVRRSRDARYRQWLSHKFGTWVEQFGTSGCVGCGRCITWCPVGIDVTRELAAIRGTS